MINLHNMCGRQIFKYYKETSKKVANIKFREYLQEDRNKMQGLTKGKQICFVIDGTGSMWRDIAKVKEAIKHTSVNKVEKEVSVIIYRDHDYS